MDLPRPLFCALLSLGVFDTAIAERTKVLLIEGAGSHDWQHRKEILTAILSRDGTFEVEVNVTPGAASDPGWATWAPDFQAYDVVLSGYSNDADDAPRWPAAVEAEFVAYIDGGGGFVAFHEAANSFGDWPEYGEMLGLRWNPAETGKAILINPDESLQTLQPGQGSATDHGFKADAQVKRLGNHPIHAGLPDSWMAANLEIWRYSRGPADNLTVLSYARDAETQLQFPVEWTVNYGAGRVYASSYGHIFPHEAEPEGLRCAAFQETLVRALKWCAGIDPPATVPPDFPTDTAISLRAHAEGFSGFGGPRPVGPFADGVLPTLSVVPTGVEVVEAFPSLGWESPIEAKPLPGQPGQLMVVEMDGRIFRVADDDATTTREGILDITDRVWYFNWNNNDAATKHGGILSTAFHPQFGQGAGKDYLYVYYLHHPSNNAPNANPPFYDRLARFTWDGSAFLPESEQILIHQYDTAKGHEGGGMCFGADGFLYLAIGDEGTESGDSTPHTQKLDDRARSGVWRIDVDMTGGNVSHPIRRQPAGPGSYTQNYYIPSDNPWAVGPESAEAPVLEEFYAVGLREPHRMSFDAATGFWIGDVGASAREEVNLMDAPGLNFQWNYREGLAEGFREAPSPLIGSEREPVHDYGHATGSCVIGGHVYRGSGIPELAGKYLFGDNGTQILYALEFDPVTKQKIGVEAFGQGRPGYLFNGISSFGTDSRGEPLLLQLGAGVNGAARISRIKAAGPPGGGTWAYPPLLSQTGVFADLPTLTPAPAMIPYDVNMPLWSAGMDKRRWVMIPNDGVADTPAERITYSENGAWELPVGSVFVKHFARPDTGAPLETRLMVHGTDGWGGVTYKWRADGSEADLLEEGMEETLTVGGRSFEYLYPSRSQCVQCHTPVAGPVLGFRTRQLNGYLDYPGGDTAHQIESLGVAGFIDPALTVDDLAAVLTSASAADPQVTDEAWVRSYFDSNCSHCHQPGGSSRAFFDARLSTPLVNQSLLCGPVIDGLGAPAPAVVKPGSIENSVLLLRMNTLDECCAMPPLAKGIIDDEAVVRVADWILGMNADSCTRSEGSYEGGAIGIPGATPAGAHGPDLWHSNLVINKSDSFTNTTSGVLKVALDRFEFNAGRTGDPVTPFVVRVNGADDFTVIAIGTTRTIYELGQNDLPFSDGLVDIALAPGETIAAGFLDANPDGSGGTSAGIVDWEVGDTAIWYSGGGADHDSGSVATGQPPVPGTQLFTGLTRDYRFAIRYLVSEYELGNGPGAPPSAVADGANSNFVINESDTFTNESSGPVSATVDRFRFHAGRVADPVTPFLVRVNADNNFTVIAIGTTRVSYELGVNDVAFSSAPVRITLAPGETIAPGFLDAYPDGSGGTGKGVISFTYGGDEIFYSYDITDVGSEIALGAAPLPRGYLLTDQNRDYYFSIQLGFGGEEDEDDDGLPDAWELAFSSSLGTFSATLDSDGDGMTDAEEFAAGTDPGDPTSVLKTLGLVTGPGGTTVSATVKTVPGRFYRIEVSPDLENWSDTGNWKAASWPATATNFVIPQHLLPPDSRRRLFVRVSPAAAN